MTNLDRLARSIWDIRDIAQRPAEEGAIRALVGAMKLLDRGDGAGLGSSCSRSGRVAVTRSIVRWVVERARHP